MTQSRQAWENTVKICPKGHCFDDDELVYCPECGLPLRPFDGSLPPNTELEEHNNACSNEAGIQDQQQKATDFSQDQDNTVNSNTSLSSSNKAIWVFAFVAACVLAFAVLELTDTTRIIPSLHQRTLNEETTNQNITDYDNQYAYPATSQYNITVYSVDQSGDVIESHTVPFYSEPLTIEAEGYQSYYLTSQPSVEVYPNQDGSPETYEVYFYYCTEDYISSYQEPEPTYADFLWHLQFLGINQSEDDIDGYSNSIKVGENVYFHALLTGGAPSESILLYYAFHMDDEEEWGSAFNNMSYDGSRVWVCCNTYKSGTLFVELYYFDNNKRISLGMNSIYIEPAENETVAEAYQADGVHWFTYTIDVYDCDEYFYVGTLFVDLPEGNVDLESYLPRRTVFNGEQYSFYSVTPSSVYIDNSGNMNSGDLVAHYAHNY